MALDDIGLAPKAEPTEFPRAQAIDRTAPGLGQAAPARVGSRGRTNFGDFELNEDEHARLANFLNEEITRAEQETEGFREELTLWREYVDPKPRAKSFPWSNASNIFVPIPRLILDTVKAAVKQTITRQVRLYTSEVDDGTVAALGLPEGTTARLREAVVRFAELVAGEPYLDLKRTLDEALEELLVAGFVPLKLVLDREEMNLWVRGGRQETVVFRSGPRLITVPAGTFVFPAGLWRSAQEMLWCGNWVYLTAAELRRRAAAPWSYKHVEETITTGGATEKPSAYQQREEATGQMVTLPGYKTYEIALVWDVYGDGKLADLLVTYNKHSNLLHRVIYNPTGDGLKPFEIEVASPRSGVWLGRGVIEPIVQPCRGINASVNQTFDAQTLANAPSVLYPEGGSAATVLANGFFPGLPIPYKESSDEISILKFPEPSAVSWQMVQFFLSIVERLTRTGPGQTGEVEAGRRSSASLGLAIAQAGRELTDELIDRIRDTLGRLTSRAIHIYADDEPDMFARLLGPDDGALLLEAIRAAKAARKTVFDVFKLRLTASSGTRSVELERQAAMATLQMTMQWEKEMIGLAQLFLQIPQAGLPPEAAAAAQGILIDVATASQLQVRRLVELSNQPDVQNIVPDIAARLASLALAPPAPQAAPAAQTGTGAAPSADAGAAGAAELLAALGGGAVQ